MSVDDNNMDKPESLDRLRDRHRKELDTAIEREKLAQRKAGKDAGQEIREDASAVLAEALESIRRRVAGSSVPVHLEYGGISFEHKAQLDRAAQACGPGEHAAIVIVPMPDRYGHVERKAWLIADVSDVFRS